MSQKTQSLVEAAIGREVGVGPLAAALRALAEDGGVPVPPTPGVPAGNGVIYRPGGVTAAPVYATWAEVQAIVLAEKGDVIVYIDDSITTPAPITGATDGFGRLVISPAAYKIVGALTAAEIMPGASLDNIQAFIGPQTVLSNRTGAQPPALLHSVVDITLLMRGSQLIVGAAATLPFIDVPAGDTFALGMVMGAGVDSLALGVPVVRLLGVGSTHAWFTQDGFQADAAKVLVTGVAGSLWQYVHDMSSSAMDTSGMPPNSTLRTLSVSSTEYTYKPGAPATSLGATQFDKWSDILANMPGSVGPRAIGPKTLWIDSTLAPGGIADVPAGSIDFVGPTTWKGIINVGVNLRFAADVRLTGLDSVTFEDLSITIRNTVDPVIEISGPTTNRIVRLNNTYLDNTAGTQPFVLVSDFATGTVVMHGDGAIGGGAAGTEVLRVIGESALYVQAYDLVAIGAHSLDCTDPNSFSIVYLDGAASLSYLQTNCPLFAPDLPNSLPELVAEGSYRRSFTNADLVANVLTVLHRLSERFVVANIFDAAGRVVNPAVSPFVPALTAPVVTMIDQDICEINFGAAIPGTYHVVVRR